ncbi:hypothetical protein [uncultured Helicobacter sp.]|nr:hypothetical protein [uncultured Helicobacter sp.]
MQCFPTFRETFIGLNTSSKAIAELSPPPPQAQKMESSTPYILYKK